MWRLSRFTGQVQDGAWQLRFSLAIFGLVDSWPLSSQHYLGFLDRILTTDKMTQKRVSRLNENLIFYKPATVWN